jgi:sulfatase modifying factor 1
MSKLFISFLTAIVFISAACSGEVTDNLVFVKGGTFKNTKSNYYDKNITISSFYVGKYDVTQKEWVEVMGSNPSQFQGDNLPVEKVSWYDCIEFCNKKSIKGGLEPYYNIDKDKKDPNNTNYDDSIKWTVTISAHANGYRLPTEAEWEYAAEGGQMSMSYTYSGSDDVDKVAWYWENSGDVHLTGFWNWPLVKHNHDRTHPVGSKEPNELGLYDMSGNVRQWCWDWYGDMAGNVTGLQGSGRGGLRVWKGGGWLGGDFCCAPAFRAGYEPFEKGPDQGFRVCRSR